MDDNGVNGNISSPGESIADIHATLRLNNSCVGRGFFKNAVCGGYGDPCTGTPATGCTGVRDADFANHVSGQPHGITWIRATCPAAGQLGPCGRETHCEGQTVSEVGWDLQLRDMRAAPFNLDANTALELTTRLFYLGSQTVTNWYTCAAGCETAGTCGCGATGGYLLVLGADDDNGNLTDGTPHMGAIFAAFNRHQQACNVPAVANTGCAGGPTTAPVVTATAGVDSVGLSWTAVPGASRYFVYRTEGISACAFGKVKVGDVTTHLVQRHRPPERPAVFLHRPSRRGDHLLLRPRERVRECHAHSVHLPPPRGLHPFVQPRGPDRDPGRERAEHLHGAVAERLHQRRHPLLHRACPRGRPARSTRPPSRRPPTAASASALTVSVAAGTTAGNYNFQARGAAGALIHTFNMSLAVNGFTLACNPASLTIAQGGNGTSTCTVQSLNAFASSVALSCSGLPAGVTCAYNPASVTPRAQRHRAAAR